MLFSPLIPSFYALFKHIDMFLVCHFLYSLSLRAILVEFISMRKLL
jgi:hypothetical protein